uniref:Uncharacterized protein n=1 Tax=Brassica oleracea TaxID=3712 RepID=A0A3P6CQ08_BRAOL|nr:unnamed protein product [Brassica oleracea]
MSGYSAPAFLSYIRKSPILVVLKLGIAITVIFVFLKYSDYIFSPNDRTYMNGNLAPFENTKIT